MNCREQESNNNNNNNNDYDYDSVGRAPRSIQVESNCNIKPFFAVWIDFNDDGTFDQNTEQVRYADDHSNSAYASEHQIKLVIPDLDGGYYRNKPHRMRIVMITDNRNVQPCYNTASGEARDYTVQIVSRSGY